MVIPSQTPKEHSEQTYNVSLYTATVLRTGRRSFSRIDVNVTTPQEAGYCTKASSRTLSTLRFAGIIAITPILSVNVERIDVEF